MEKILSIARWSVRNFRNICAADLLFSNRFNVFLGDNAAGKTSVLESIYYLSTGKSFRTHHHEHVIQQYADALTIYAEVDDHGAHIPIGLSRDLSGVKQARVNGKNASAISQIADYLPVQFIGADSYRLLTDGPKVHRQFIDWGLFHTTSGFYAEWQRFQKLLLQRNAALKANASKKEMLTWNEAFSDAGVTLHTHRMNYLSDFLPYFKEVCRIFFPTQDIHCTYFFGWAEGVSLADCLGANLFKEYQAGYTLYGPHRADVLLRVNGLPIESFFSQGQQKLLSYALRLAQGMHLQSKTNKQTIYLIDDFPSELDATNRQSVINILTKIHAQLLVTGIYPQDMQNILHADIETKMFHVKHGEVIAPPA